MSTLPSDPQALFGELRAMLPALVAEPSPSHEQWAALFDTLEALRDADPARYDEAVLPYLSAHPLPVATAHSLDALARHRALLPARAHDTSCTWPSNTRRSATPRPSRWPSVPSWPASRR